MRLMLNVDHPQPHKIAKAVDLLRAGELLCYPTDTGYGIGCDPHQPKAVERLFRLYNRPKNKRASLLCNDFKQISKYAYVDDQTFRAAKRALPGPYTLILKATKMVSKALHGKRKEVGIRVPDHPVVLALVDAFGAPILNVTARDFSKNYLDDPYDIEDILGAHLGAVIDCEILPEAPSTVVDFTQPEPEVLRVGQGDPDAFLR